MATKTKKAAPKAKAKVKAKPKAKSAPKKTASRTEKKAAPKKKTPLKLVPPLKPQAEVHPMRRLLEMKEQQRKVQGEQGQPASTEFKKHIEYRHQAKFAKFAGPRRRAA